MGLLDELQVIEGRRYGSNAVDRMLDGLDDEHREGVRVALHGPMGHAELGRKLQKHGLLTDVDAAQRIAEWRRANVKPA